jgi:hypothetical protein
MFVDKWEHIKWQEFFFVKQNILISKIIYVKKYCVLVEHKCHDIGHWAFYDITEHGIVMFP